MKASRTSERSKLRRNLWIDGTEKPCAHEKFNRLVNYADEPIADVCKACQLRLAEFGICTGCGSHKRLIRFGANGVRFCGGSCFTRWEARTRLEKKNAPKQPHRNTYNNGHT